MAEEKQLPAPMTQLPLSNNDHKASEKIEMQRATAMVFASFQRAIQFPRDEQERADRILKLCENVGFASEALYKVPRGGQTAEGFGIKAAKEFARIWGNVDCGYINHGRYGSESQMESFAFDLETNFRFSTRYTVDHRRSADGDVVRDPIGVSEIEKSKSSREVRNCMLSVIPYYVLEAAEKLCKRTIHSTVDDIPKAFQACVKSFAEAGITETSLWRFINRKPEPKGDKYAKVTAADIVDLRVLYRTGKEEPSQLDAFFPERDKAKKAIAAPVEAQKTPAPPAADTQEAAADTSPQSKEVATELPKSNPSQTSEKKSESSDSSETSQNEEVSSTPSSSETVSEPPPNEYTEDAF